MVTMAFPEGRRGGRPPDGSLLKCRRLKGMPWMSHWLGRKAGRKTAGSQGVLTTEAPARPSQAGAPACSSVPHVSSFLSTCLGCISTFTPAARATLSSSSLLSSFSSFASRRPREQVQDVGSDTKASCRAQSARERWGRTCHSRRLSARLLGVTREAPSAPQAASPFPAAG